MGVRLTHRTLVKTAAYTVRYDIDASGTVFSNRGAAGSVTFTLPPARSRSRGVFYVFDIHADQTVVVAATAGQIATLGNAAANNVSYAAASAKIGRRIVAFCDGIQWQVHGVGGGGFHVNGTQVEPDLASIAATVTELNRVADVSGRLVAAGSTLAVTEALHDGKIILLNALAGSIATLPAATGSGARFNFRVSVLATSNSHIVRVTTTDIIQGIVMTVADDSDGVRGWRTADDSDTITLNRSTMGSVERGEWLELLDVAAGVWLVRGQLAATGTEASPFSAAV